MVKEQIRETTTGDTAVDGLLAGGMAGVLMAVYLTVAGLTWGDGISATLGRFDPGGTASPVVGAFTDVALSMSSRSRSCPSIYACHAEYYQM